MWLNLIEDLESIEFVYNLSYGKDSMAGLHVTIDILGIPVSRIVHAEVWATDTIPADLPPMVEFKAKADAYIKERWGLTVEHVYATRGGGADPSKQRSSNAMNEESTLASSEDSQCSAGHGAKTDSNGVSSIREKLTYEKLFYHVPERKETSQFVGGVQGFPWLKMPWCNGHLKMPALRFSTHNRKLVQEAQTAQLSEDSQSSRETGVPAISNGVFSKSPRRRGAKKNIVHLLGIAADEPERIARYIDKPGYVLPLVEADWHEDLCGLWCQYEGMLSPVYENACRSGCWFCHNQGVDQLRLLRTNYPGLWAILLKWDLDSPVTFKADGHTVHDFDRRFAMENMGLIPADRTFRWKMLDEPPKFVAWVGEQMKMEGI